MTDRKRHRDGIIGYLQPDEICTTEGVMAKLGIGEEKLSELRTQRGLPAYRDGKRLFYLGRDLIEAVLKGSVKE